MITRQTWVAVYIHIYIYINLANIYIYIYVCTLVRFSQNSGNALGRSPFRPDRDSLEGVDGIETLLYVDFAPAYESAVRSIGFVDVSHEQVMDSVGGSSFDAAAHLKCSRHD